MILRSRARKRIWALDNRLTNQTKVPFVDGGGIGDKSFFRLHKKFCKFSPRGPPLTGSGKIDRENKKPHVRIFLGLKDRDGLEGYR